MPFSLISVTRGGRSSLVDLPPPDVLKFCTLDDPRLDLPVDQFLRTLADREPATFVSLANTTRRFRSLGESASTQLLDRKIEELTIAGSAEWDLSECPAPDAALNRALSSLPTHLTELKVASPWLRRLPKLRRLSELQHLSVSSPHLTTLPKLPKGLQRLSLVNCRSLFARAHTNPGCCTFAYVYSVVERFFYDGLEDIPDSVTELDLSGCHKLAPWHLEDIPSSVSKLTLSKCPQINGDHLEVIPKGVTHLVLVESPQLTGGDLAQLKNVANLDLSRCRHLKGPDLQAIPACVMELILAENTQLNGSDLGQLPPQVRFLNLSGDVQLTADDLRSLPDSLTHLNLTKTIWPDYRLLEGIPPSIENVSLEGCMNLDGTGLKHLPSTVTHLFLNGCPQLKPNDLRELFSSITFLNLGRCSQVTGAHFEALPRRIVTLRIMHLGSCKLTLNDLQKLPHSLRVLAIDPNAVSQNDIQAFIQSRPHVNAWFN